MGVKPILFNYDMVRAILADRKTVTRRVVKPQPKCLEKEQLAAQWILKETCAPYHTGDILYVRETWACLSGLYLYKADLWTASRYSGRWRPSIHMPKEAARLFLRLTAVRMERLQEITEEQAKAEGATLSLAEQNDPKYEEYLGGYYSAFSELWNSTIKKSDLALYGWGANPWVFVIEFCKISKEEAEKEKEETKDEPRS